METRSKAKQSQTVETSHKALSHHDSHEDERSSRSSSKYLSAKSKSTLVRSHRSSNCSSASGVASAKQRKAVIEAQLKSQSELNQLELQHAKERAAYEREQIKRRVEID